jgi:signal transduction histidine kinase
VTGISGGAWLRTDAEVVLPGDDEPEPARLLATRFRDGVLVVGASNEDRADALDDLLTQMLVGGPAVLAVATLAGWLLAGAAFRPVEAMRRRAAAISSDSAGERLPVPRARNEMYRLGTTLNDMLDRLDDGLRRERRFVADASHELRTPLALLQTELELALRRRRSREELEATLRLAAGDVDRLARLAEDLLVLATGEDGRLPVRKEPVDVPELLRSVAQRFSARAAASRRLVEVDLAGWPRGATVTLSADRVRLEHVLGDLVDNALRHGTGQVRLEAATDEGSVVLRVRDEGPGFPPDFLPHAFERFSRSEASRTSGGAGLGLAIVEAVAQAHGGVVQAGNDPGGGAVVTLRLPCRRAQSAQRPEVALADAALEGDWVTCRPPP